MRNFNAKLIDKLMDQRYNRKRFSGAFKTAWVIGKLVLKRGVSNNEIELSAATRSPFILKYVARKWDGHEWWGVQPKVRRYDSTSKRKAVAINNALFELGVIDTCAETGHNIGIYKRRLVCFDYDSSV